MNPLANFFNWLRRRVAEAVLGGVADAAEALDADPAALNGLLPEALRQRLTLALPAPAAGDEPEPAKPTKRAR